MKSFALFTSAVLCFFAFSSEAKAQWGGISFGGARGGFSISVSPGGVYLGGGGFTSPGMYDRYYGGHYGGSRYYYPPYRNYTERSLYYGGHYMPSGHYRYPSARPYGYGYPTGRIIYRRGW